MIILEVRGVGRDSRLATRSAEHKILGDWTVRDFKPIKLWMYSDESQLVRASTELGQLNDLA